MTKSTAADQVKMHSTHTSELYQLPDGDMQCPECKCEEELKDAKREIRELRKHLKELCDSVGGCILALDAFYRMPSKEPRGVVLARIANTLEIAKDRARHFGLGEKL